MSDQETIYFAGPGEFRDWLDQHHASAGEQWVGFHKVGTGVPSMTWPESVDEALCYGWIDGQRRSVDAQRYRIRFTPRRAGSVWSAINIARVAALEAEGRMRPAGLRAFAARQEERSAIYAYEQRQGAELSAEELAEFAASPAAWAFFQAQPAGYRRTASWWVVSAKRPETRRRRLETLIADSAAGRTIKQLTRPGGG